MISKSNKFPTRIQFLKFRQSAHQLTTPHLRVMVLPHVPSRLSVIVPIKVSKKATTRNSFKRVVYDAAWKILESKNLDCIILFKPITLTKGPDSEKVLSTEFQSLKFDDLRI
ncbi:ribonuclease P protein component [Candidatus Woesebacteria bacterium]|nr:ribonuclease P protein component [Candidatus Woesebacteria bacterium]